MKMMANKGGKISENTITTWIIAIILIVVLFNVMATLFPELTTAGTTLNSSGFPLGSLFVSGGAIWYILAIAVIVLLFKSFKSSK